MFLNRFMSKDRLGYVFRLSFPSVALVRAHCRLVPACHRSSFEVKQSAARSCAAGTPIPCFHGIKIQFPGNKKRSSLFLVTTLLDAQIGEQG